MVIATRPNERSAAMMDDVYRVTRSAISVKIVQVVRMKTKIAVCFISFVNSIFKNPS